jgi:excinuclease ABC subunit C
MNKKIVLEIPSKLKGSILLKIPESPGVYLFLDKNKKTIYVGKAKNLKNRLSSYFSKIIVGKTKEMVRNAKFLSFIKTESEIEALILEANLIKKYQPKYNVIQKDDKSPLYIIITKDKYPRLLLGRKSATKEKNVDIFYGPFLSTRLARKLLRNIRKLIPFSDHKIGKKPCLYSQIGLCNPCPNAIEKLENKTEKEKLFEEYKKNIKRIKYFLKGKIKKVESELISEMDYFSKKEEFEKAKSIKEKIEIFRLLTQPVRNPDEYLENPNLVQDQIELEIKSFADFLNNFFNIKKLDRIECYDISHISGAFAAASMVVFVKGEKSAPDYRRFRLKVSANNDRKSLIEVINRRLAHLKDWGRPDLMIIDGGRPQVSAVFPLLAKEGIPVVGIAKKFEELVIPVSKRGDIFYLKYPIRGRNFGNLVVRIRDESHRFAKKYHQKLFLLSNKL